MKLVKAPGVTAYAAIALWFLLTVLTPIRAQASESTTALRAADILPAIELVLTENGVEPGAVITLVQPDAVFFVPAGMAPIVDNVSVNPASGRFVVRVLSEGRAPLAITGTARTPVRVPVLIAPVARGETVEEANLDWIESADGAGRGVITSADELVGMIARRPLTPGAPLRVHDVAAPILIKRGALVTMIYETAGLTVTHTGVAREDGAAGDLIDIENAKSEQRVKAIVAGDNLVRIASARHPAQENNP